MGSREPQQYPLLSLAIIVNGNQITAKGDDFVQCPNSGGGGGGTVGFTGQIAADGTFELNTPSGNYPSFVWTINGTVPPAGESTWSGTYSLTTSPSYTGCTINQGASFTATAYPTFDGTYAGTLLAGSALSPTGSVTISLDVAQGAAVTSPQPIIPITGSITVVGSACFTHGTSTTSSGVGGDYAGIFFNMDDGSQVAITGFFASQDESTLTETSLVIFGGQCSQNAYAGTLTRQ